MMAPNRRYELSTEFRTPSPANCYGTGTLPPAGAEGHASVWQAVRKGWLTPPVLPRQPPPRQPYRRRGRKWRKSKVSRTYPNLLLAVMPAYANHIWARPPDDRHRPCHEHTPL